MPSYRVTLVVGLLRPGTDPADVLPAAVDAARRRAQVEASDVGVVRGEARITVRFLETDDAAARVVARDVAAHAGGLAEVGDPRVTRRWGARWFPLDSPGWRRPTG